MARHSNTKQNRKICRDWKNEKTSKDRRTLPASGRGLKYNHLYVEALVKFFDYVKGMGFEQTPDYDYIRKIFKETLINRK